MKETAEKLVTWIADCVHSAKMSGTVFGMSGGVDSSVVAVLCKRAFSNNCMGLIMPCYSSPLDREHAEKVATKFNIPLKVVRLDKVFDALVRELGEDPLKLRKSSKPEMEFANIKPRLRMTTLYYYAKKHSYLVVGSSNRSEIAMGYFTKWGDSGVDIMPIGELLKRDVVDLARYLGVPSEIIEKPPSAGLWIGQTDEEEMGINYADLDAFLSTGRAKPWIKQKIKSSIELNKHRSEMPLLPQ